MPRTVTIPANPANWRNNLPNNHDQYTLSFLYFIIFGTPVGVNGAQVV